MSSASTAVFAKHFWRGETLSNQKVADKWGKGAFDSIKFKDGDDKARASMAFSLLAKKKDYMGKSVLEIRRELGSPDGFYFSDVFPAYMIHRGSAPDEDSWQIVFLLDKDRRVNDIIVHKNCCN